MANPKNTSRSKRKYGPAREAKTEANRARRREKEEKRQARLKARKS